MESFVVSARKYRPAVFEHVVGQSHITTTLKNAIKNKHLAQAFLFCGPRGVGKTTCARILAKTINCQQVTADAEPCNTCLSCNSFNNNRSLNVHELDAASNNSVEDIRALVEQVRYTPQAAHYKVYIIDEVHMLSHAAFNAFLKTLEEPPSYAIFILATTEKHKIIPTILSRCQIFDFHRIQPQDIVQQLKQIAQQEGLGYDEEALFLISQRADGALRDALSIFDLITTFASGQSITLQATQEHLHILDHIYYCKIVDACLQGNPGAALLIYDEILKKGFDGHHFITGLSEHLRNLMMSQDANTLQLLAVANSVKEQYQTQARRTGLTFLFKALSITNQYDLHYKNSNNKRLHVELALIELANIQHRHIEKPSLTTKPASTPPEQSIQPKSMGVKAISTMPQLPKKPQASHVTLKLPQLDQLKQRFSQLQTTPATQPTVSTAAPLPLIQKEVIVHLLQAYAQKLKRAGKMSEYSLLNQEIMLDSTAVVITLINPVQQDILASIQEDIIIYLRTNLQRTDITLRGVVTQTQQNNKPYTAQEKFKYLIQKHPALHILQEKLALEVQD